MSRLSENQKNYTLPFILASTLAIGVMVGIRVSENRRGLPLLEVQNAGKDAEFHPIGRIEELLRFIESKYVDEIDTDTLIDDAIYALIENLDPHSDYLTPSEVTILQQQMEGYYKGLGVETSIIRDTPTIFRVLENSPAQKGGFQTGDKILKIGDEVVAGVALSFEDMKDLLQFSDQNEVDFSLIRNGKNINKRITLGEVPLPSISSAYAVNDSVVYIKIERFGDKTYKEFMEHVEKLFGAQSKKHLIIDVRGNPGGYLPEATNILCQIFEDKDKILVTTKAKNQKKSEYKSTGKRFFDIQDVAVLVDENSASASEIIAGAIQDWDRGIVVGRRTYGKGLVQEQYELSNGGAIRLTVAKYYTPSGRSIQRNYSNREVYVHDLENRYQNGEIFHQDKIVAKDSSEQYASLLKGRKLSSYGGVDPDVIVPLDSFIFTETFESLEAKFVEYFLLNKDKPLFSQAKSFQAIQQFSFTLPEFDTFLNFTKVNVASTQKEKLKQLSEKAFKNILASVYLSEAESIRLDNQMDEAYLKTIRLIGNKR